MFPKVILLDFDGVIIESVGIKDWAFEELYRGYPQHLSQIMEYHLSHNATIRFTKFHYIAEHILKERYDITKEQKLSKKFSDLVFRRIVQCPLVKGAKEFLDDFSEKVPLYLISISPEEELSKVLDERKLKKYFQQVYANPIKKSEVFQSILSQKGLTPLDAVYIGDTPEDYQAAVSTGIPFIGRKSKKEFPEGNFPVFSDLEEVRSFLIGKQ
ncbi:HAD hydrolase-like protein [Deltaproteobacteria bacterium TL4]